MSRPVFSWRNLAAAAGISFLAACAQNSACNDGVEPAAGGAWT